MMSIGLESLVHMSQFRITTNGISYQVQKRVLFLFWVNMQRPENLNEKDFGGDVIFFSYEEAEEYIKRLCPPDWVVTKNP
jgi:hypothetical protein